MDPAAHLPTASSAADVPPVSHPAATLWSALVDTWSLIARSAEAGPLALSTPPSIEMPPNARLLQGPAGLVQLHRDQGSWVFRYQDGLACRITASPLEIQVSPQVVTSVDCIVRVAGSITAMVMDACRYYPMHAAGVVVDQGLVAVHAPSGTGKSTLVAVLASAGFSVAGDDLLPVGTEGVVPGIPGALRVDPALAPETWDPLLTLPDGRGWYPLAPGSPRSLAALLLMARGTEFTLDPVRGTERMPALLKAGFLSHLDPHPAGDWHLRMLDLAGRVPVFRLTVPGAVPQLLAGRGRLLDLFADLPR